MRNLDGRVAVVTGAASGIGRALSEQLATKGCLLALVDIDQRGLAETAERITTRHGRAISFIADVSDRTRMEQLPSEVIETYGAVHLLVNNAGVTVGATFAEQPLEDFEWIFGINLWGVVHGCKFFLPHLEAQDEAHIVNLSSVFGFFGLAGQASYCMTKAAIKALSEALWTELADTSVRVTSVHPGGIKTNIIRDGRISDPEGRQQGIDQIERFGHTAEKAARKIVRAIQKDRRRVLIGPEAYALDWVKRLLPVGTHRLLTAIHLRSPATKRARERKAALRRLDP